MGIYEIQWTRKQLYQGCILASIAHAIMVAHYPDLSHEHSWDGINYNVQDSAGTRGTISFHPEYCVAAFRNERSSRISSGDYRPYMYFKDAPSKVIDLAEAEALQYLLDKIEGETLPVITTAFWGEDKLFSHDSSADMIENGAFILKRQVLDINSAIKEWVEFYDMGEIQFNLMKSVYEKKINNPSTIIRLSNDEINMIGCEDNEDLFESKTSFKELGILLEV